MPKITKKHLTNQIYKKKKQFPLCKQTYSSLRHHSISELEKLYVEYSQDVQNLNEIKQMFHRIYLLPFQ
jgi:uncharacterized protein YgiM (DUF1202 family)